MIDLCRQAPTVKGFLRNIRRCRNVGNIDLRRLGSCDKMVSSIITALPQGKNHCTISCIAPKALKNSAESAIPLAPKALFYFFAKQKNKARPTGRDDGATGFGGDVRQECRRI